jgi:16S rRNA (cytosine967-C5)-methyltransferase
VRGRTARSVALEALERVEDGAYANLVLPGLLSGSGLSRRDRAFVTELVYGTTRMRRACDWALDAHLRRPVDPRVRRVLRLGAYQLLFAGTPSHASVSATVAEAPAPARGLVNAVLRRVADTPHPTWPDEGTRLSYPDWVVERLCQDLGRDVAVEALAAMNRPAAAGAREDGYVQDAGSRAVALLLGASRGHLVVDLCAAPGGKATEVARACAPGLVTGVDARLARARLLDRNARSLGLANVAALAADGRLPPLRGESADRVLVDAPCSGIGAFRRRPDARWRAHEAALAELGALQRALLDAACALLRPGGVLVYSVCTMTSEETTEIDLWMEREHPELVPDSQLEAPWRLHGRGRLLLPQDAGTDGMYALRLRRAGMARGDGRKR